MSERPNPERRIIDYAQPQKRQNTAWPAIGGAIAGFLVMGAINAFIATRASGLNRSAPLFVLCAFLIAAIVGAVSAARERSWAAMGFSIGMGVAALMGGLCFL